MIRCLKNLSLMRQQPSGIVPKKTFSVLCTHYSGTHRLLAAATLPHDSASHTAARRCHTGAGEGKETNSTEIDVRPFSKLFHPAPVKTYHAEVDVGAEMVGPLDRAKLRLHLQKFYNDQQMRDTARENGLDDDQFYKAFLSFRKLLENPEHTVDPTLHVILYEITSGSDHVHSIFPYFMIHARKVYPHLLCFQDLRKISDLTSPINWYSEARAMKRKIIFHAGPTNSGKTYHAMNSFLKAESGVYCGPLKLLANEVYNKSNNKGTPCDLVTGEERLFGRSDGEPSAHTACTVEMASLHAQFDVAVIDEIQEIGGTQRGWAWTRALLGLCAKEVHVCGEAAALPLVQTLAEHTGEEVEVHRYDRLTPLTIEDQALGSLENVQPGDCFVCFNRRSIQAISGKVRRLGHEVAIIYGAMPPNTKLKESAAFNDPEDACSVMVATDAIGMGLNLSIRRVIFASLYKPTLAQDGTTAMELISVSQALQIAGRAGRFGTQWSHGYVTTLKHEELSTLKQLLASTPEGKIQAGLHPTAEQIEMFAYHMPHLTMSGLVDLFQSLCRLDDNLYFMCQMNDFKILADLIQSEDVPLRARYVFCCAPISSKKAFLCTVFVKMVRQFAMGVPCSAEWMCQAVGWPFKQPSKISELEHLEQVFDCFDLYLWLSYRFPDMFQEQDAVRSLQSKMDELFAKGIKLIGMSIQSPSTEWGSKKMARTKPNVQSETNGGPDPSNPEETSAYTQMNNVQAHNSVESEHFKEGSKKSVHARERQKKSKKAKRAEEEVMELSGDLSGLGGGKLARRLIAKGLLSPSMLSELQREMTANGKRQKRKRNKKEKY